MNFLHLFTRGAKSSAKFADGRVGYAVGDVHGRADLLAELLAGVEERARQDTRTAGPPILVFLGDYVDRGPDSAGVLDLLLSGQPANCERRYLRGNHEQAMLAFMANPAANRGWLIHGGAETLLSYGVQPPASVGASEEDLAAAAAALKARVPEVHIAFLEGLERYLELGGYVFVHAGIDPGRALSEQTDDALYWARDRFLDSKRRFSHRVVHGHTPSDRPYADARRIGIDTGAYASGVLTAARFEGDAVTFFSASLARRPEPSE